MDAVIITAAVIVFVIALIELITFFFGSPAGGIPASAEVLPVFAEDTELAERLSYLSVRSCGKKRIIIVDYSADPEQDAICRHFVRNEPYAEYISCDDLKKKFAEIFAIR